LPAAGTAVTTTPTLNHPTRAQQIKRIETKYEQSESSTATTMERRQKIKKEINAAGLRVKENLKRQKIMDAERAELKQEEEVLIQTIERLKIASKAQVQDILEMTKDLTPLGVGAHNINAATNRFNTDHSSSDDSDDSEAEFSSDEEEDNSDKEKGKKQLHKRHSHRNLPQVHEITKCEQLKAALSTKLAISIMLFISIMGGVFGVGWTLLDAGQSSIDNQVTATLRLAARQSEFKIRIQMDTSFHRVNMLADAVGRTDAAGTDAHVSNDMFWLESRDMLQVSSAFYAKESDGALHGAQRVQDSQDSTKHSLRLLEKEASTGNKYQYYPTTLGGLTSSPDGVSLDNVKDSDKIRDVGSTATVLDAEYDPRQASWYTLAKEAATTGQPATNVWSDIYHDASSASWMVTSARAVYNNIDANGAVTTASPTVDGVVGVDFDVERIANILEETRKDVLHKSELGTVTMFMRSTDGKSLRILASSDTNVDKEIQKAKTIDALKISTFVKDLGDSSGVSAWMKTATATAASYAEKMFDNKLTQDQVVGSNYSYYHESLRTTEDNTLMVSVVKMDDVIHGCYITIVLPRASFYE